MTGIIEIKVWNKTPSSFWTGQGIRIILELDSVHTNREQVLLLAWLSCSCHHLIIPWVSRGLKVCGLMAMPYFKTPLLTICSIFFFSHVRRQWNGWAIFDKTSHDLILEGVIILYVVWLNPVKPVTDGTEHTEHLVLFKYWRIITTLSSSASVNKIDLTFWDVFCLMWCCV